MRFATAGQAAVFVWMAGAGACIVVWYALTALLRRFVQAGFVLNLLIDLLFGLGAAGVYLFFLISGNRGTFRLYTLLGTLFGVAVFACGLARPAAALRSAIYRIFLKSMTFVRRNRLIKFIFK